MLKRICNSQVFILVIISLFFSLNSFSQTNLLGEWSIIERRDSQNDTEYVLRESNKEDYGKKLTLSQDGTFFISQSIPCLNDCAVSTSGTYNFTDDYHIRMIVEDAYFFGLMCGSEKNRKANYIKDLGAFYIYKDENSIRLISSNGILQDDKDKMLYTQMINSFDRDWKSYQYVWNDTKGKKPEEIIKDCIDQGKQINWSTSKIVFSKDKDYGKIFLLKENQDFYYVVYSSSNKKVSLAYSDKNKS